MQGEDLPQPTNRVDLDPTVRDVRGFPVARITYRPHRHELVASAHHGPRHMRRPRGHGGDVDGHDDVTVGGGRLRHVAVRRCQDRLPGPAIGHPRQPPCHGDDADGDRPLHLGGGSPGEDARTSERRGGRFVGLRDVGRIRADPHFGGPRGARAAASLAAVTAPVGGRRCATGVDAVRRSAAEMEGQETLGRLELLGGDVAVLAGMGVQAFVGAPQGVEQRLDHLAGEELVVPLHEEEHRASDVGGVGGDAGPRSVR